ncbi:MAG: hypothetical protein ACK5Y6_09165 [Pseudomonadota bacterium]
MDNNEAKTPNFFEKFGCEVQFGEIEVGTTYPLYGMITKIIDDTPGQVVVEINFSITATMTIPDQSKVELLKERAFEPGIFVSTVTTKEPSISVDCSTVVFGKRQGFAA